MKKTLTVLYYAIFSYVSGVIISLATTIYLTIIIPDSYFLDITPKEGGGMSIIVFIFLLFMFWLFRYLITKRFILYSNRYNLDKDFVINKNSVIINEINQLIDNFKQNNFIIYDLDETGLIKLFRNIVSKANTSKKVLNDISINRQTGGLNLLDNSTGFLNKLSIINIKYANNISRYTNDLETLTIKFKDKPDLQLYDFVSKVHINIKDTFSKEYKNKVLEYANLIKENYKDYNKFTENYKDYNEFTENEINLWWEDEYIDLYFTEYALVYGSINQMISPKDYKELKSTYNSACDHQDELKLKSQIKNYSN